MACKDAPSDVQQSEGLIQPLVEARDCPQHPGSPQKVFCETCGIQMCFECQFTKHKDHDTQSVKDVVHRLQRELASYQPKLLELEAKASEDVRKIPKDRSELRKRHTQELEALQQRHRVEIQELDDKEALAKGKVPSLKSLTSGVSVAMTRSDVESVLDVRTKVRAVMKNAGVSTDSRPVPTVRGIAGDDVAELDRRLAAGADPNHRRDGNGSTPLMTYCLDLLTTARPRLLQRLCSVANINMQNKDGFTALHFIVQAVHQGTYTRGLKEQVVEALEVLLAAGADASLKTKNGNTPGAAAAFWSRKSDCSRENAQLLKKLAARLEKAEKKKTRSF